MEESSSEVMPVFHSREPVCAMKPQMDSLSAFPFPSTSSEAFSEAATNSELNTWTNSPINLSEDDSDLEITHCSIKEPSSWMQIRSHYRKLQRMHPYADEKMKLKQLISKVGEEYRKFHFQKEQTYRKECDKQKNLIKKYEEQINQQRQRINTLEERIQSKDEQVRLLEKKLSFHEAQLGRSTDDKSETENSNTSNEEPDIIIIEESSILRSSPKKVAEEENKDELIKSQNEKVSLLENQLTDLKYRVKKQEMQIQLLETDLKYKDDAASNHTENAKIQEVRIQLLEAELDFRKNTEDTLKVDKERLEGKMCELTKSCYSLKCENLSLNEILKEKKNDHEPETGKFSVPGTDLPLDKIHFHYF